ncbi:MAG: hypothetical protein WB443_09110, partial [Nitrososphaeraceae archaeon]
MARSIGIFATLLFLFLFLMLNNLSPLSSSLFFAQDNNNGDAGVRNSSNSNDSNTIGKKREIVEAAKGGLESSFHNLLLAISPQYAYAKEHAIAVQHGEGPKIMVN